MKTRSLMVMMIVGLMIIGQGFVSGASARGPMAQRAAATTNATTTTTTDATATTTTTDTTAVCSKPAGNGPGHSPMDILSGAAVTITGTITEISAVRGPDEVRINTGSEVVTVCGLGPAEYWTSLGFTRPVAGDVVTVDGYNVTLSDGSQKIFSAAITVGSNQVQLIDAATGKPLFQPKGDGPGHGPMNILSGTAVTITGTITEISAVRGPDGVKINTGTEVVTVYGLGPAEYWTSLGFTRPVAGDAVTVDGYSVTTPDGSQKIFAAKITIGSNQVQLIDTTTGKPLWQPAGDMGRHGRTL